MNKVHRHSEDRYEVTRIDAREAAIENRIHTHLGKVHKKFM